MKYLKQHSFKKRQNQRLRKTMTTKDQKSKLYLHIHQVNMTSKSNTYSSKMKRKSKKLLCLPIKMKKNMTTKKIPWPRNRCLNSPKAKAKIKTENKRDMVRKMTIHSSRMFRRQSSKLSRSISLKQWSARKLMMVNGSRLMTRSQRRWPKMISVTQMMMQIWEFLCILL